MAIEIKVENKRATTQGTPVIICCNEGYTVHFTFDAEWGTGTAKTARFVYLKDGSVTHTDVPFTGDTVEVPALRNIRVVRVGVFEGDLRTTTPAVIPCELSIRCGTGAPADPTPSQYDQIMELLSDVQTGGGASILYTPQTLTDEQKAQARENIGIPATEEMVQAVIEALPKYNGEVEAV